MEWVSRVKERSGVVAAKHTCWLGNICVPEVAIRGPDHTTRLRICLEVICTMK